jgi:hypothetical protein
MEEIVRKLSELIEERKAMLINSKTTAKKKEKIEAQIIELEDEIKRVVDFQKAKDEASKK